MDFEPQQSPVVKQEGSPAESFVSAPGESFPSLFAAHPSDSTNNWDMRTPDSSVFDDEYPSSRQTAALEGPKTPAPDSEKKPTKKRKSWGQVLPEPKTNLPPRKRAKTEDEKEQRRVERVIRNRKAAQTSRERKRKQVDNLEERNRDLEVENSRLRNQNEELKKKLQGLGVDPGVECLSLPAGILQSAITLGPSLSDAMDDLDNVSPTVDPASLSPHPGSTTATHVQLSNPPKLSEQTQIISSDMTQHPAAMLCDLPCQSQEITQSLQTSAPVMFFWMLILLATLAISLCQQTMLIPRPFTPISSCLLCLLISMTIQWTPWSKTLLDFSRHLTSTWNMIMSPPTEQITTLPKFWRRAAILMRPLSA